MYKKHILIYGVLNIYKMTLLPAFFDYAYSFPINGTSSLKHLFIQSLIFSWARSLSGIKYVVAII